jgi:hypothetical protein
MNRFFTPHCYYYCHCHCIDVFAHVCHRVCCIYLASKAEEAFIKLGALCHYTRTREDAVKNLEVPLLEGIKFHLRVYHPYRPLRGLLQTIKQVTQENPAAPVIYIIFCLCTANEMIDE